MNPLAIVILNWNGADLLRKFLPGVLEHSPGATVYVADNASTDDSVELVKTEFPAVRIIQNPENGGYAMGYNKALTQVEEPYYCLLNSDVEVSSDWLSGVIDFFQQHPRIGILQPKIKDYYRRDHFEYAGAAGGFLDKLGYPFCRGRIFQTLEKDEGQYDDSREIFWATGACMFIRKSVFRTLKGFDETYFAHQEEIDLCWRAQLEGYKVQYFGQSEIYHMGGSTLSNMNPKKTFLNFRNSLYTLTKNLPAKKLLFIVLARLVLDAIAAYRFIFQWKWNHAFAIIRAHFSYYANLPQVLKRRSNVKILLKYHSTTSIVWSYYVNQVKNFNILVKD